MKETKGYFINDGSAYVVKEPYTQIPFTNVLYNADGYLTEVTQWGTGECSVQFEDKENCIISQDNGKALFLRNENTGKVWCPGVEPMHSAVEEFQCEHGDGYSVVSSVFEEISVTFRIFVPEKGLQELFNYLIRHIQELMQDVVIASERKKMAELRALQSQINPHFIYNTLNSISSVVLLEGRKEIAAVLNFLSQIIRYNIKKPDGMVPLKDDIKIIRCYVSIQQFTYRNEVQFTYDIAPETEDVLIPKVLIQPLVENAFIHGMNIPEKDTRIRLSVYIREGRLCIQVWDSGTDVDGLWMNQYIRGEENLERSTDSLGIRNVYERICMVYRGMGDLVYSQDEHGCTEATIYLPLEKTL